MFFTAQDILEGKPQAELNVARSHGRAESEGWRMRKDGSLFWANAVLTPVHDGEGMLRGFAKVTRDLSAQRRLHEVEQAGRRMQEFIAMLAHELRNPLAPIRNAVSLMKKEGLPEASRQHASSVIDRQLGHLTHLVDDLLDVGRIATGKIWLRDELIDFRQVVVLSLESVRHAIEARGHELVVDLPEGAISLRGDATRLTQALLNLLTNAAKYTPEHGRIVLKVAVEDGMVVAAVTDNGRGVALEAQERIFDLFTQERPFTGVTDPGLGIGLALARALVEQHGGQLSVESAGLGQGGTFRIRLPLVDAAAACRPGGGAGNAGGERAGASARARGRRQPRRRRHAELAARRPRPRVATRLRCPRRARGRARGFAPDVVFLDLNMPDGDGISLLPQLRAIFGDDVHVAALTGYGQQHDRDTTRAAGFQEHLTKPVDIARLEATLATAAAPVADPPLPLAGEGRGEVFATLSPRSPSPAVQRLSPLPLTEIDMPTRRLLLTLLAAAATSACTALPAHATGNLVDLQIVDRGRGDVLTTWRHRGTSWVAGRPGDRYALRLSNRSGGRVLVVLSVDGVNVVSGETASIGQTGYVLGPWASAEITGWRKGCSEAAAFYFTALPDSYAARTGRPDNVGVIGAAVFRERVVRSRRAAVRVAAVDRRAAGPTAPCARRASARPGAAAADSAGERSAAARPPRRSAADAPTASRSPRREKLGTGHGEREYSPTTQTTFERASSQPAEIVQVRYDSYANLVAAA